MAQRYRNRTIFNNDDKIYDDMLEDRALKFFRQYESSHFRKLTPEEEESITVINEVWQMGDRLYKYAEEYYGDPTYWWVIGRYNEKPTDSHFKIGDVVYIPVPRQLIVKYYKK